MWPVCCILFPFFSDPMHCITFSFQIRLCIGYHLWPLYKLFPHSVPHQYLTIALCTTIPTFWPHLLHLTIGISCVQPFNPSGLIYLISPMTPLLCTTILTFWPHLPHLPSGSFCVQPFPPFSIIYPISLLALICVQPFSPTRIVCKHSISVIMDIL